MDYGNCANSERAVRLRGGHGPSGLRSASP